MTTPTPVELARLWFEFRRLARGTREERYALSLGHPVEVQDAEDTVEGLIENGGPAAVDVVR